MPDISKIKLPSGNTYDIVDAGARELISSLEGGSSFAGKSTTAITDKSTTSPITIDGKGSVAPTNGMIVAYGNSEFIWDGAKWLEFGDLSNLGNLAVKDSVSLSKGSGDNVLGEATTFTTTVTPSTTNIKATASGTAVGANGTASAITGFGAHSTDTFVKSVSAETNKKLVTTSVPNVTSVGAAATWSFSIGTGSEAETLIISGGNGSAPTLGTAITAATGETDANGAGDSIVTGVTVGQSATAITALGAPTTANCLTGVKVTTQPTVSLSTGATAGTGVISVATGITSATTSAGSNDTVSVAKYSDLGVSVS